MDVCAIWWESQVQDVSLSASFINSHSQWAYCFCCFHLGQEDNVSNSAQIEETLCHLAIQVGITGAAFAILWEKLWIEEAIHHVILQLLSAANTITHINQILKILLIIQSNVFHNCKNNPSIAESPPFFLGKLKVIFILLFEVKFLLFGFQSTLI